MSIPFLPRGVRLHHDNVRGQEVLLGPERALMLDQIACEILKRVDGVKTKRRFPPVSPPILAHLRTRWRRMCGHSWLI